MLTAIIRERYIKKKNPTVSKNMDMFTRMGGGEPDGKMMGQQTKGQTM